MNNYLDSTQRKFMLVVHLVVLAAATVLAGMTSIFSYYTLLAVEAPKCLEEARVEGYRTGIADLLAIPLFSLILVVMIARIGSGKSARGILKELDAPIARLFSLQITLGMFLISFTLIVFFLMIVPGYIFCTARYDAVGRYCLAVVRSSK
jgi:hypothetical protein